MNFLLRKLPISIMILGSLSLFLLNFILKKNLSEIEFGKYSILATFITMISSFGLFGSEQLLIRNGNVNKDYSKIHLNKSTSSLVAVSFLLTIIFSFIFDYLKIFDNKLTMICFSFFCIYLMFSFNVFRLLKRFILSQIIQSLWKILIIIIIAILILFNFELNYEIIQNLFFWIITLYGLVVLYLTYNKVNINIKYIKSIDKKDFQLTFYFFISLLTMSLIGNGDRLLIENKFNIAELGNYFFLNMLILFPFTFIQSYLGFIYIVEFKESKSPLDLINEKKKDILKYLILLLLSNFILIYLSTYFKLLTFSFISNNLLIIIILIFTGIIRLYYSIFSSFMGAKGKLTSIKKANIISFIISSIIIVLLYFFAKTLLLITFGFFVTWLFRLLTWKYYCLDNEN